MRTSHLLAFVVYLSFFALISTSPRGLRGDNLAAVEAHIRGVNSVSPETNSPPIANDDTYTRHGNGTIGPLLQNDSDPEGDPLHLQLVTFPTQGQLFGIDGNSFTYGRNSQSFFGTDTFTYKACDNSNACSAVATVTIHIVNNAPVATADSYAVHGGTTIGPMMANDYDIDGDAITWNFVTAPAHGTLLGPPNPSPADVKQYIPHTGYVGSDSFTYKVCDQLAVCSAPATVTLSIDNSPPIPGPDFYVVRKGTNFGPLFINDFDPEGDEFLGPYLTVAASHGIVYGLAYPDYPYDVKQYVPEPGYAGIDSWEYEITDYLGASGRATVTLFVLDSDDAENAGRCSPCPRAGGGAVAVGKPINVTNGNMYLQQTDYQLPGVGPELNITRTYNSMLPREGLFGRGWSTVYDASIKVYGNTFIRLNLPDGRAVYFTRPNTSAAFKPVEPDFHGEMTMNGDGSFTLSLRDGSVHRFNAAGKLLSLADRYANHTTLTYNSGGHLVSVSDPSGRVLSFATNANGRVLSISDTVGTIATYTYGPASQLLSTTYPDGSLFQFSYDGNFRLTSVIDALGNVLESHTYDSAGRALTSEKQGGVERYTLNYVSDTQTDVTDALGNVTKYTADKSKGRNVVTRVEGSCGCGTPQIQSWTYDAQLNVSSNTTALNYTTTFTYDADGNRLTTTDDTGTVNYTYNQFGDLLTRTDQLDGVSSFSYDTQRNLISSTNALNKTATFTYDPRGLLLTATDARGKTTSLSYDANGHAIKKTNALGHETQFGYDARGQMISVTNALGHTTSFVHDPAGRPIQVTQPDGSQINYEYDLAGRRIATTDAKGARTSYSYDGANRLTSETDPMAQTMRYSYDLMSNLTAHTDALGRVANYDYDGFNRLVKITYPPATAGATRLFETFTYDVVGNVTQRTDTAGRVTKQVYDLVGRVTSTTDETNKNTSFEYDSLSRTTALVDALGQRYRFNYDAVGQLKHIRRGSTVMSFTYDGVGNRKTRTDYNGALTTYDYDGLNRLKTTNYPDVTSVSYTYDKLSRLQTATNENGSIDFDYNKMNRLTSASDVFGQLLEYNYDVNGNRTKLSLNAAVVATYRYDTIDRLTKIIDASSLNTTYDYDFTNKLVSRRLPNGALSTYQYDGLDRLTRLRDSKGVTTVADHQYQYNTASQITQIIQPTNTRSYGYDPLDRLTSATYTNPSQSAENYAYDAVGNRTNSHLSASYGYQRFNRLTSTSSVSYSYDTNGNLTSKTDAGGTWNYSWDFENRLKQVVKPGGVSVSYKYDALGRRIQRTPSAGVSTNFVYDGQDVVKDLNSDGSTVDYLNGLGIDNKLRLTDSRLASTGPLYFLQDQLGSTTALTNSAGAVTTQLSYDAFGNSTGSSLTRYDYTGRERDPDTGLIYYRARWYDPQVGRFISEDPIGLVGGINQFAYVSNNPQNATDPSGLYEIDVHYYLTYFIATKTGCFTAAEARLIADANQGTDENASTAPGAGLTERQRQQNRDYHDLQPRNYEGQGSPALWQQAMSGRTNYVGLGQYLHHLQDSFSHAGYESDIVGHLRRLHYYDKTASDVPKALRMAGATWKALNDYAREKKCGCEGKWDASWWQQVVDFSREHGANFDALETIDSNGELDNFGMRNSGIYLLRKRIILGLPPR